MTTGEMIKKLRKERGFTQEELGNMIGVGKAAINKYETGIVVNLKRSTISNLAQALHVSPVLLLDDSDVDDSFSDEEERLLSAYRSADQAAREYALMILESSAAKADYGKKDHSPAASDVG